MVLYNYWHGKGSYGTLSPAEEIRYSTSVSACCRPCSAVTRRWCGRKFTTSTVHVSERLGFAVSALSAFRPPDDNDALDALTRATLAQFFQAVATLEDAAVGYRLNHHREAGVLALNLNEILRATEASGVPLPHRSALLRALSQSRAPFHRRLGYGEQRFGHIGQAALRPLLPVQIRLKAKPRKGLSYARP